MIDVGVIIPCYNYGRYLGACVASLAEAMPPPVAVTFVDDASTDGSLTVWNRERERLEAAGIRTRTVARTVNGGTAAALNAGIAVTPTEWVMPLAADDRLKPFAFEEMARVLERHPEADVVQFGQHAFGHDSNGVAINPRERRRQRRYRPIDNAGKAFQKGWRLSSGCSPFRRILWCLCPFPEDIRYSEDTAFWVKAGQLGARFRPTERSVVWVRYHAERKSFTSKHHGVRKRQRIRGVRRHMKRPLPRLGFYTTESHFVDHLLPILDALPENVRHLVVTPPCAARVKGRTDTHVVKPGASLDKALLSRPLWVVASTGNYDRVTSMGRAAVYVYHGTGQLYDGQTLGERLRTPYDGPRTADDLALLARTPTTALFTDMQPVDFYASETHFMQHLAPIYLALPERLRGRFVVPAGLKNQARDLGVNVLVPRNQAAPAMLAHRRGAVVVSASGDHSKMRRLGRRVIFCEHGAGQSYPAARQHSSYAGYPHRQGVVLFLVPGPYSATLNRKVDRYKRIPIVEIGCPKLDPFLDGTIPAPTNERRVVVISFHWDCKVCPETRSAFDHFKKDLAAARTQLARHGIELYGHAHPRLRKTAYTHYEKIGLPILKTFDEVLRRADAYVIDNSSTLFEFAATGRPVVVLNSPHYRKNVRHGLRFWDLAALGPQVDRPADLVRQILEALDDTDEKRSARLDLLRQHAYAFVDGTSAARAAAAITDLMKRFYGPRQRVFPAMKRSTPTTTNKKVNAMNTDYIFIRARTSFKNGAMIAFVKEPSGWQFSDGRVKRGQLAAITRTRDASRWLAEVTGPTLRIAQEVTGPQANRLATELLRDVNPELPSQQEAKRLPAAQVFPERFANGDNSSVLITTQETAVEPPEVIGDEEDFVISAVEVTVARRGSWYTFSDGYKTNGRANAVAHLTGLGFTEAVAVAIVSEA